MNLDLAELERLYAASTQGEWVYDGFGNIVVHFTGPDDDDIEMFRVHAASKSGYLPPGKDADLGFVLALHNAFPALAARVRELEAALVFIGEYWNGNRNDRAMSDALDAILGEVARVMPAKGDSNAKG